MENEHFSIDLISLEMAEYDELDYESVLALRQQEPIQPKIDTGFERVYRRTQSFYEWSDLYEREDIHSSDPTIEDFNNGSFWLMDQITHGDILVAEREDLVGFKFVCKFDAPIDFHDVERSILQVEVLKYMRSRLSAELYGTPTNRSEHGFNPFFEARSVAPGSIEIAVGFGVAFAVYKAVGEYPKFRDGALALKSDLDGWRSAISKAIQKMKDHD